MTGLEAMCHERYVQSWKKTPVAVEMLALYEAEVPVPLIACLSLACVAFAIQKRMRRREHVIPDDDVESCSPVSACEKDTERKKSSKAD